MVLGIAEDFTSNLNIDTELLQSDSGLYLNSGVHPMITLENLLYFLPDYEAVFASYDSSKAYSKFETSRKRADIVNYQNTLYQSLQDSNTGNTPSSSSEFWLETNIESLRLKNLIYQVTDRVKSDLNLTKRLVNNQFIYEQGDNLVSLPNDYASWIFEPKGSDYVTLNINQIAIQADGTTPISVYVINQNTLVETIQVAPSNGELVFRDVDITFTGKGKFMIAIDSQDVYTKGYYVDPLVYDGFTCYTGTGTGDNPESANYSYGTGGNGIGFNISAYLDAGVYIDNNISSLANFVRATLEYIVFNMFLHNANNRSNRVQRLQMNDDLLMAECKRMDIDTVCKRYSDHKKKALSQIEKTFDTQLFDKNDLEFESVGL